jgi:hypothetical protein
VRLILTTTVLFLSACVSRQPGLSKAEVDKIISDERAQCAELTGTGRESVADAQGHAIEPMSTILALEALRSGNTACVECLLQGDIDGELLKADQFVASSPPPAVLKVYQPTIEYLRTYRESHPWDRTACTGVCAQKR